MQSLQDGNKLKSTNDRWLMECNCMRAYIAQHVCCTFVTVAVMLMSPDLPGAQGLGMDHKAGWAMARLYSGGDI